MPHYKLWDWIEFNPKNRTTVAESRDIESMVALWQLECRNQQDYKYLLES